MIDPLANYDDICHVIDNTSWQNVASYMDDDIRERVHSELAPCTEEKFLQRYCALHAQKYHAAFAVI